MPRIPHPNLMSLPPILRAGFRPFFFGGPFWALAVVVLWICSLAGEVTLPTGFDPLGEAAKALTKLMHPHFAKEDTYALPPLGFTREPRNYDHLCASDDWRAPAGFWPLAASAAHDSAGVCRTLLGRRIRPICVIYGQIVFAPRTDNPNL